MNCFPIRVLLAGAWMMFILTSPVSAAADSPTVSEGSQHSDLEVLTTCGMHIYTSIVMRVYDLESLETMAKSKICGVEEQFSPAQSLEEISQLFADYGIDKTARQYQLDFDDAYIKQVLSLTEIILKSYQQGYEKALIQQLSEQGDTQLFCTSFRKSLSQVTE